MNNETELKTDNEESQDAPTPKGEALRAKMLGLVGNPSLHGCYVFCGIDGLKIGGEGHAPTDLLPGFDYVIVPVKRVEGRAAGLGWVKFK